MSRLPIRARLTGWFVLVLAVLLVALGVFVTTRLRADLTAEVDRGLRTAATQIVSGYRDEGRRELEEASREFLGGNDARASGAQVLDSGGGLLVSAGSPALEAALLDAPAVTDVLGQAKPVTLSMRRNGTHLRVVATPVRVSGRAELVIVADSLGDVDSAAERVIWLIAIGGLAALVLAAIGGSWIAGKGMRPIADITTRARLIDATDLTQRVPVPDAHDELRSLAETVNAMLARLERGVAAREQLVADASHELRGPLAAMRAELDVSLQESGDDDTRALVMSMREEVDRMTRIVTNLLTLARVDDGGLELLIGDVDLRDIADRSVRAYSAAARPAGVTLTVIGEAAVVAADGARLEQVVGNLVDNAIRFAPPDSEVVITTSCSGDEATISVDDAGPGVPHESRERIFERFARAEGTRPRHGGAGLGLAICRQIAAAHGGVITVDDNLAGGACFALRLPMAPARAPDVAPSPAPDGPWSLRPESSPRPQ